MRISGVEYEYYHICKTQLWLFSHNIDIGNEAEIIKTGKVNSMSGYKREMKELEIDGVKFDVIKSGNRYVVYERKMGKYTKGSIEQLKYYLYKLHKRGIDAIGFHITPGKRIPVRLTKKDISEIEYKLKEIEEIINLEAPPKPVKNKYCKHCAYREFCFGDDGE